MKILAIGDTHFKDNLSYADYISDKRVGEKKEILDFIIKSSADCDSVVLMGDCFDSKNPSAQTVRDFVSFIESFKDKDVYMISGNHSKKGDGTTALDFLKEIKNKPNWHVFTKPGKANLGPLQVDFLPFMLSSELGVEDSRQAEKKMVNDMEGGDIIFAHHAISGTTFNGMKTDDLSEPVLNKEKLEEKFRLVVAGHIHTPQQYGNVLITGNLFTIEVGETEKFIFKINEDLKVEKIKVPARAIHKLVDPTTKELSSIASSSIVKVILTNKKVSPEELKEQLSRFDANLLVEDYPDERKKAHIQEGAFDFSLTALLKLYSEEKGVDLQKLMKGLQIING